MPGFVGKHLAVAAVFGVLAAEVLSAQVRPPVAVTGPLAAFETAWRIVRDTHFDPTFGGLDWERVRAELEPRAAAARTLDEVRAVIREMLRRLGQSHFALLPSDAVPTREGPGDDAAEEGDPGLEVRWLDEPGAPPEVVVTRVAAGGAAEAAGVHPGWAVTRIDGEPVARVLAPLASVVEPRRRRVEAWRAVMARLRGPAGSEVHVTFLDGTGAVIDRPISRTIEPGERVRVGHLPPFLVRVERAWLTGPQGRRAGLIRFNVWMTPVDPPIGAAVEEFQAADGIIVDLRGNPGGLAALLMGVSGYFLDEPVSIGTMRTRHGDLQFVANPRRVNAAGAPVRPYAGPVAVLVDGLTGSASECFAAGLQALGRVRVFGEPTMGQALPALVDRLPTGDVLLHAYGDFIVPGGARVEGRGVSPDEVVPLRRADLLAGRDAVLDAALAWIARTRARADLFARTGRALLDYSDPRLVLLPARGPIVGGLLNGTTPGAAR